MTVRILIGDVRDKLAELPDESVHCVVTSPPYMGLRDYGTARWDGGDPACTHATPPIPHTGLQAAATASDGRERNTSGTRAAKEPQYYRHICGKCGAVRIDNQIGLEPTLAEYIDTMTAVFRDVRRVLRSDGVCFLNIGDSYVSSAAAGFRPGSGRADGIVDQRGQRNRNGTSEATLKPKDLMMVPARLALALQADGWWLRSDIIWHKPNPMPESVTDRPTNAHEHIFLLTKSARYWYDADAVREVAVSADRGQPTPEMKTRSPNGNTPWLNNRYAPGATGYGVSPNGANLRNVWSISTQGFPGAHFATFPPEIPRRCIKAGCPEGGVVLDPFFGSGTTGLVADQLGRDCIGIELNPEYARLAENRIRDAAPMFAQVTA